MASWHITCCMYCNTDVVITKPVTGRASVWPASLKTTWKLIALGFHTEKEVSQHSHSRDPGVDLGLQVQHRNWVDRLKHAHGWVPHTHTACSLVYLTFQFLYGCELRSGRRSGNRATLCTPFHVLSRRDGCIHGEIVYILWCLEAFSDVMPWVCVTCLAKNLAHPHFERIELRPEIIMVTFDLNTEQIFKAIGCPIAKKQFETHVGY